MNVCAEDRDSHIIKLLEAEGSQLCLEAARRLSYYSDEVDDEPSDDLPSPNYTVSNISDDFVYIPVAFGHLRLNVSDITGNVVLGSRLGYWEIR